jgi:hypothetical protein
VLGQGPAPPLKSCVILLPPASGLNANRFIVELELATGCESTQMMGFVLPLDEMVVKKPGVCLRQSIRGSLHLSD